MSVVSVPNGRLRHPWSVVCLGAEIARILGGGPLYLQLATTEPAKVLMYWCLHRFLIPGVNVVMVSALLNRS
jgi:glycine/D-amino acid oxidase-like deaminating enzyme